MPYPSFVANTDWVDDDGSPTWTNDTVSAAHLNRIEAGILSAHRQAGGILLDDQAGADDTAKLINALALNQSTSGRPPVMLSSRNHDIGSSIVPKSGHKLIGALRTGQKNLELSGQAFVGARITLTGSIGSGTSSLFANPTEDCYNIYMADFGINGSAGSSTHQFFDFPVSSGFTLYACEFRSLTSNFLRGFFGRKDRPIAFTQVNLTGTWTAQNLWDTQFTIGGSDNSLWMAGYINMGPSGSSAQTGTYADNDYEIICSSLSNTNVGYIYLTALNGWRGLKVTGSAGNGLFFYGGVYEGYKGVGTNLSGPAPGSLIRVEGGSGAFFGPNIGQGMANPDAAEGGLYHQTGGEWTLYSPTFYRGTGTPPGGGVGPMAETVPCIFHAGGRLAVHGATRRQNETWTSRPRFSTAFSAGTGANTWYMPDQSMVAA